MFMYFFLISWTFYPTLVVLFLTSWTFYSTFVVRSYFSLVTTPNQYVYYLQEPFTSFRRQPLSLLTS